MAKVYEGSVCGTKFKEVHAHFVRGRGREEVWFPVNDGIRISDLPGLMPVPEGTIAVQLCVRHSILISENDTLERVNLGVSNETPMFYVGTMFQIGDEALNLTPPHIYNDLLEKFLKVEDPDERKRRMIEELGKTYDRAIINESEGYCKLVKIGEVVHMFPN